MDFTPQPIGRAEFNALYVQGEVIVADGVRTTLAQDRRKGRLVMVHEVGFAPGDKRRIMNILPRLADAHRALILGAYLIDEEPVIVTKFLLGFVSFREWAEHAMAESATVVLETRDDVSELDRAAHDGSPAHLALKTTERQATPMSLESVPSLEATSVGVTAIPGDLRRPPVPGSTPRSVASVPATPAPPARSVEATQPAPAEPGATHGAATGMAAPENDSGMFTRLFSGDAPRPPAEPRTAPPAPPKISPAPPVAPSPTVPAADEALTGRFFIKPVASEEPSLTEIFGGAAIPTPPAEPPPVAIPSMPAERPRVAPLPPPPPASATTLPPAASQGGALWGPGPSSPAASHVAPQPVPVREEAPAPDEGLTDFNLAFGGGRGAAPLPPPAPIAGPSPSGPPGPPRMVTPPVFQPSAPPPAPVRAPAGGLAVPPPPPLPTPDVRQAPPILKAPFLPPAGPSIEAQGSPAPLAMPGSGGGVRSDMTEMLRPARPPVRQNTPAPALPDPAKSAAAPAKGASMTPLIIVLSVCAVLVVATVIYVVATR